MHSYPEASPLLLNIFIFLIIVIYSLPSVYTSGGKMLLGKRKQFGYLFFFVFVVIFSVFGYADWDFYGYQQIFNNIKKTGDDIYLEPIYIWIIKNISSNYYWWRLIVWGSATLFTLLCIRRLKLDVKVSLCIFSLFYLVSAFFYLRVSLGLSIMFLGLSYIIKPSHSRRMAILWGIVLILLSYFFHRSMFVAILFLFIAFIKLSRKQVVISLIAFPFLVIVVNNLLEYIVGGNLSSFGTNMQIGEKMTGYASAEMKNFNINGIIMQLVYYIPVVLALFYVVREVTFKCVSLPNYIHTFYSYWYCMTYLAFLFYFQDTSYWLFMRFMAMAYFPMVIVLTYFYMKTYNRPPLMKIILLLGLLSSSFRLLYTYYSWSR